MSVQASAPHCFSIGPSIKRDRNGPAPSPSPRPSRSPSRMRPACWRKARMCATLIPCFAELQQNDRDLPAGRQVRIHVRTNAIGKNSRPVYAFVAVTPAIDKDYTTPYYARRRIEQTIIQLNTFSKISNENSYNKNNYTYFIQSIIACWMAHPFQIQ